jgi:hypothetical protein
MKVKLYHGTSKENLLSIIEHGINEAYFTNNIKRALSYNNGILIQIDYIINFKNFFDYLMFKYFTKGDFFDVVFENYKLKEFKVYEI